MLPPGRDQPPLTPIEDVVPRAISAGKFAVAGELVARVAQPLMLVVLARFLAPEEFGLVTAAAVLVSFAHIVWEAGLARALIQRPLGPAMLGEAASAVFWTNLLLASALYVAVFVSAPALASGLGYERLTGVLRVQGVAVIFSAAAAVPLALRQRALDFRVVLQARVVGAVVPGIVGIPLAWQGGGYWALVAGAVAGTAAQAAVLFWRAGWRPRGIRTLGAIRSVARFAVWSTADALLSWTMMWADVIVVGSLLAVHELGLYRTGDLAVRAAFGLALGALMPVLFSMFSRLQSEPGKRVDVFVQSLRGTALVAMFLMAVAVAAPRELTLLFFGPQWHELAPIVAALAVVHAIGWLVGPNAELYRGIGRPDLNAKIIAGCLLFYLPAYVLAAERGLEVLLGVRIATAVGGFAVHVLTAWRVAGIGPARVFGATGWFVVAGGGAAAAGWALGAVLPESLPVRLGLLVLVCTVVFALLAWPERRFVAELATWIRRRPA